MFAQPSCNSRSLNTLPFCFPQTDLPATSNASTCDAVKRPKIVKTVFDRELDKQPIKPFDESSSQICFPKPVSAKSDDHANIIPSKPEGFSDPYCFPMLARNERERLTQLWYYTRNLTHDTELIARLQEKVDFVTDFIGWDFTIMGILDNDVYTRIAVSNLPLAVLPRRESTCAHTINYAAKSVLMLPNMSQDWRFQHSPHVKTGGLRSYAGTQLLCKTSSGKEIPLGSLCVASNSEGRLLSKSQQAVLVRFAEMLSDELVNRVRIGRHAQRKAMTDLITSIHEQTEAVDITEVVIDALRQMYPTCTVTVQASCDGKLQLTNRPPIHHSEADHGLWEDCEYVERAILTTNHSTLEASQTVRVIVSKCTTAPEPSFVVVDSHDMHLVFDDIDAWFVEKCALTLCGILQRRALDEALRAKDNFFRDITHQLRTPIHGVLGSCELLAEELDRKPDEDSNHTQSFRDKASTMLQTINSSGRELMLIVNNVLRLNKWAEMTGGEQQPAIYDLYTLEEEVYDEILQLISPEDRSSTSIFFHNQLEEAHLLWCDQALLKECLHALILNALQNTTDGGVTVATSVSSDFTSLRFDVIDTGCGIDAEDFTRLFGAYEKGHSLGKGAGLGLTLASKVAALLGGSLSIISSVRDDGSHFRLDLKDPVLASPWLHPRQKQPLSESMPRRFCEFLPDANPILITNFANYLKHQGFVRVTNSNEAINLLSYCGEPQKLYNMLERTSQSQVNLCLVPNESTLKSIDSSMLPANVLLFSGPFFSCDLDKILARVDQYYQESTLQRLTCGISPPSLEIATPFLVAAERESSKLNAVQPIALLVDDNPVNLRIMRIYCEKRNLSYRTAEDGLKAVQQYEQAMNNDAINLILMDLQMPLCDGAEATAKIRELEQANHLRRAAIFMVTGQDSVKDKARSFECGADEFFVKPMRLKELDRVVGKYFDGLSPGEER